MKTALHIKDRIEASIERIPEAGCWIWNGSAGSHGYGDFRLNKEHHLAHRASYEEFHGPIPKGLQVLHRCDNRLCVNPAHLFVGTNADNMRDKCDKGRWKGQGPRKLTGNDVEAIRSRRRAGETLKAIAADFNVHSDHIRKITNWKIWTNSNA